jgi:hypothetical protein
MSGFGGRFVHTPLLPQLEQSLKPISGLPAVNVQFHNNDRYCYANNCTTTFIVTLKMAAPCNIWPATTPALGVGDSKNGTITVTLRVGNNNPSYTYEITGRPASSM